MFRDRTEVSSGDYHFTKTTDNLEFKSFTYLLEEEGGWESIAIFPLGSDVNLSLATILQHLFSQWPGEKSPRRYSENSKCLINGDFVSAFSELHI